MWTQTALEYPVDANENPAVAEALYQSKGKDKILVYPREALNQPLPPGGLGAPTVFADGLAIPLGILPWGAGDSCYALHGHDLLLLADTDGDGKSDKREVILTGFGIQDSHLFPHQFTRAPGGWVWMAQGLFNNSSVRRPGDDMTIDFPKCSMARMRPDGSKFEVTSTGPNNIWGLVISGEGETFIQEANDFGYSVMAFHEYAYYPGGMSALRKSYQPEFPPIDLRMGGTGLSGLAIVENGPGMKSDADFTMLIANPITTRINAVTMKRDGSYWKIDQIPDFVSCDDPFFRPVGMTQGPDGCIYIVDWYNKIISHNEVPRNHPDRDKTRGRIWRIKPRDNQGIKKITDFTKLPTEELIALLGTTPTARAHLAWQTLADRQDDKMAASLKPLITNPKANDASRIQALWILSASDREAARLLVSSKNRNVRRELARYPEFVDSFLDDSDREVRFAAIQTLALQLPEKADDILPKLLGFAKPSLDGPTAPSTRSDQRIPVREAYDREFERFLVRMFLERNQKSVITFLDSEAAKNLPTEALILATLALEPKTSVSRIATLLPTIGRAPNADEIMRLAQFPNAPGSSEAIKTLLASPDSAASVVQILLTNRTTLDPKKVGPFLSPSAKAMLEGKQITQAAQLIGSFQLSSFEPNLVKLLNNSNSTNEDKLGAVKALRQLHSTEIDLLAALATASITPEINREALAALAESRSPDAGEKILELYPKLGLSQRRDALSRLSTKKTGAKMIVTAFLDGRLPKEDLDGPTADRLSAILHDSPELAKLMESMSDIFHDVLLLDGSPDAWTESGITLEGPFTVETWVRLAPKISNQDGILGARDVIDLNFHASTFRFWIGGGVGDVVVSKKPVAAGLWTHLAVSRDATGQIKFYHNGELDAISTKKAPDKFADLNIGWTGPNGGTKGALAEFRVWNVARNAKQIRQNFDRSFADGPRPEGLTFYNAGGDGSWGKLGKGAHIAKMIDAPPLLTAEQSKELDAKFAKYIKLGQRGGDIERGKVLSALCTSCHVIKGSGGKIGPELSGAGAMGLEGVLRNILTPNAAMESGYRIFRVELKNGDILDSFFVSETRTAIVVRQPGGPDIRLAKKDITATSYIRRSLMPEGLLDTMSDEMAADLLAYLMTLK